MKKEMRLLTKADKEDVLNYLERNHMETTFLIGNVLEFGLENDNSMRRCGDYYGYFEEDNLRGILPFYNLGSSIPHFETENAITYFVEIMREREFEVLLGMANVVTPIYDKLKDHKVTENYSDDSYFINNDFKPYVLENVIIKDDKSLDIEEATKFLVETRKKGFGDETTREEAKKMIAQGLPEEDRVFVIKDGKTVAHAVVQATTSRINQIGGVYTSEEYRGNGYCKAVVSELCERIIKRGKIPTLMVRKNNTPAVRAYTALGFKYYTDYLIITFKLRK